jgi:ELWxxDGT repeat protein
MTTSRPSRSSHRTVRSVTAASALVAGLTGVLAAGTPATAAAPDPTTTPAYGAAPYLLADAAPGAADGVGHTGPTRMDSVRLGGRLYYTGADGVHGQELWVTDGTRTGTRMLADLWVGPESSGPTGFVAMGGRIYFTADAPQAGGDALWVSDGTAAGTKPVADVDPHSPDGAPREMTVIGHRLWFAADTSRSNGDPAGRELFVSDGTTAGTRMVADLAPGAGGSYPVAFTALTGDRVAFVAGANNNHELWVSDGTEDGTAVVRDLNGTATASVGQRLVRLPSGVVLFAGDNGTGRRLWRSDGTFAGTVPVDSTASAPLQVGWTAVIGGEVYFTASSPATGIELFGSDGTAAGTHLVGDLAPGTAPSLPEDLTAIGGTLWFVAYTAPQRAELWSYRPGGLATMRAVLNDEAASNLIVGFTAVNGALLFGADLPGGGGTELWTYDAGGLRQLTDLDGAAPSYPSLPVALGTTALWTAKSKEHGWELFAYNTQPTRTRLSAARTSTTRQARRHAIRVRVTVRGGPLAVSGPVEVREGSRVVGTGRVTGGRAAVRLTRTLGPGRHRLVARFTGSTTGRTSTSRAVRVRIVRGR